MERLSVEQANANNHGSMVEQANGTKQHHFWSRVGLVVFGLLFFLAMSANQTIFNSKYITKQVQSSNITQTINDEVNTKLQQVGVDETDLLSDDLVSEELETMIGQFYNNEKVELDQTAVKDQVNKQLGTGIVPTYQSSIITSKIITVFNSQLNTEKLTNYAGQVAELKYYNQILLWVSGIATLILLGLAFIERHGINAIGSTALVIGLFVAIIAAIAWVSGVVDSFAISYKVFQQMAQQVGSDILVREFTIALGLVVLGVVALIIDRILKGMKKRI